MMNRDRVKVAVRCRPLLENEDRRECVNISGNTCFLTPHNGRTEVSENGFAYDFCFERDATQEDVFEELGSHVMSNAMDGYNATLFAYGQTGSGKTHSLHGSDKDPGVLPRMIARLFSEIESENNTTTFVVKASYLEIYNERIRDLLVVSDSRTLDIKQHADNSIIIPNLSECVLNSASDALRLMEFGNSKRTQGSTSMNDFSSRSHSIFTLDVTQSDESEQMKRSKINIVDLAGSERQSKAQSSGERLREGCIINQSLTYLSCCINALVNGDGYVPFRNSKLTHFLSDCLAGNSKTAMLATISPASMNFDETISTLRFATKCKKITTSPSINICHPDSHTLQLRNEVESLKSELRIFHAGIPGSLVGSSASDVTPILSRANFLYFVKNKETRLGSDPSSHVVLPPSCPALACKIEIITNGIARCTPFSRFMRNERVVGKKENESFHLDQNDFLDFGSGATFRFTRGVLRRSDVVQPMADALSELDLPDEQLERACDTFEAIHHLHSPQYGDRLRELHEFVGEKAPDAEVVLVQNVFHRRPPELGVKQAHNLLTEEAFRFFVKQSSSSSSSTMNPLAAAFCKGDFKTVQSLQDAQEGTNKALDERVRAQRDKIRTLHTLRDLDIQSVERLTREATSRTEAFARERDEWREERLRIQEEYERTIAQERENSNRALEEAREQFALEKTEWQARVDELSQTADAYDAEYHNQRSRACELEEILEGRDESIHAYRSTIKDLKAQVAALENDLSNIESSGHQVETHSLRDATNVRIVDKTQLARSKTSSSLGDEKKRRGRCVTPTRGNTEVREFSLGAPRPEAERPVPSALAVTNQEKAERWARRRNVAIENSRHRGDSWSRQSARPASVTRCSDKVYPTATSNSDATCMGTQRTAEDLSSGAVS